ncbi:hypothetical protein J2855_003657 [Agrobacterium tumefaciens]|uniref:hypothetical protein n=1 Tax=Agrobacterium tumefaciens TaxID=358 RepID=UPI0013A6AF31|nr:hypothetical protein [Agrobacterium tumefaciens]MBP2510009.1 hypothetical protein [Agrobacterium tumefaciens]MBP2519471.1 hypothetical protein [Agrobacterium tumefaciens]MBP2578202.1 hypothetical protein [Agrobacterium tumefaciens]MBP2596148.1 hypothetical protein [Agrobacterium tumefaciens]
MSNNSELIKAIKDTEIAIKKAINTLKDIASETEAEVITADIVMKIGPGMVVRSDMTQTVLGVDPAAAKFDHSKQ